MSNISNALRQFSLFFDASLDLYDIENKIDRISSTEPRTNDAASFENLAIIKTALNRPEVFNHLIELSTECRSLHSASSSLEDLASWEQFVTFMVPDQLLVYFTCLIEVATINPCNPLCRRLALISGQTFFLLQTVPGAKAFGAFHPPLIQRSLMLLNMVNKLLRTNQPVREHEQIELLLNCVSLLDDVVRFLKVVSLVEHDDIKKAVVGAFNTVVQLFYDGVNRSKYIFELYEKSFTLLENLCQTLHGDRASTLTLILNGTMQLNRYTNRTNARLFLSQHTRPTFTTINDWFIAMLTQCSKDTTQVLTLFVHAILTKPSLSPGGTDALLANIDICVLYDSAMYRKCNESITPFLQDLACSAEAVQRTHSVEFVSRALLVDSVCDWMQPATVDKIPREIAMVRILMEKMLDVNNTVKIKAMNGFLRVATSGNLVCKKIFQELFLPDERPQTHCEIMKRSHSSLPFTSNENNVDDQKFTLDGTDLDNQKSDSTDNCGPLQNPPKNTQLPGLEDLYEFREKLLLITRHNLINQSALVRKAAIHLLEFLAMHTLVDLGPFLESQEMRMLHADSSSLVRRQLVLSLDQILGALPTNQAIIGAYVRLTLDLAADDDARVQDTVLESFKRNIFDNIQSVEHTTADRHLFPWRLLRAMLSGKDTPDLRGCIGHWVHKKLLTSKILAHIETHINSAHSTEAWILLSMVASKISSRNPERVVTELLRNLQGRTDNLDNPYMQLEVLACWLDDLSATTLNEVFEIMCDLLTSGGVVPRHVQRVYEICWRIAQKRQSHSGEQEKWALRLADCCKEYVKMHCKTLVIAGLCNAQLVSYIYIYAETLTDTTADVDAEILEFLSSFLQSVIDRKLKVSIDHQLPAKVNCVQSFLTKLALFNYEACLLTIPLIGKLLDSINDNSIINTSIACLSDLYKKHTSLAQSVLPFMLTKTRHKFPQIRNTALKNVVGLIIDEYIKFRGATLMYVMAALSDPNKECSELAHEILLKYTIEKNTVFMRSCLLECPFVLNGYVYLDNLEMFSDGDADLCSPMKGSESRADRQYVYRFFIHNISVEQCYAYFGNLHLFMDKLTHEAETMTRPEGLAAVQDFLYVLTHICRVKEKNKRKATAAENGDSDEEGGSGRAGEAPKESPATIGRGRKGNVGLTVEQSLHIVEKAIPRIAELNAKLHKIDPALCFAIDILAKEMSLHFAALTEYAQPQSFWKKYNCKKTLKPRHTSTDSEDESSLHLKRTESKPFANQTRSTPKRSLTIADVTNMPESSDREDEPWPAVNPTNDPVASTSGTVRQFHRAAAFSSDTESESDSDIESRNARLTRKRLYK